MSKPLNVLVLNWEATRKARPRSPAQVARDKELNALIKAVNAMMKAKTNKVSPRRK